MRALACTVVGAYVVVLVAVTAWTAYLNLTLEMSDGLYGLWLLLLTLPLGQAVLLVTMVTGLDLTGVPGILAMGAAGLVQACAALALALRLTRPIAAAGRSQGDRERAL